MKQRNFPRIFSSLNKLSSVLRDQPVRLNLIRLLLATLALAAAVVGQRNFDDIATLVNNGSFSNFYQDGTAEHPAAKLGFAIFCFLITIILFIISFGFGKERTHESLRIWQNKERPAKLALLKATKLHLIELAVFGLGFVATAGFIWWSDTGNNPAFWAYLFGLLILLTMTIYFDHLQGKRLWDRALLPGPGELSVLLIIVCVGAFLRLWQLADVPWGIWYDEAEAGLEALKLADGAPFSPMGNYTNNNPALFFYLTAGLFHLFGPSLTLLRLPIALTGIAGIGAIYLLGRELFGRTVGLTAAAFLAVMSWQIDFSRFMLINIGVPLTETLTFYFLFRAVRRKTYTDWLLSGLFLGLSEWMHTSSRLIPLAVGLVWLHLFLGGRRWQPVFIAGTVILGLFAVMVALPIGEYALTHKEEFLNRTQVTSVFRDKNCPLSDDNLTRNLQQDVPGYLYASCPEAMKVVKISTERHLLMFNYIGDQNGRHGLPFERRLDFLTAIFFVPGLFYAVWRSRHSAYFLIPAWLMVALAAGIFSLEWEAPQSARTLAAAPVVALAAAIALSKISLLLLQTLRSVAENRPKSFQAKAYLLKGEGWQLQLQLKRFWPLCTTILLLSLLFTEVTWLNFDDYFNKQMSNPDVWIAYQSAETQVARLVQSLKAEPNCCTFYFMSENERQVEYLNGRSYDKRNFNPSEYLPTPDTVTIDAIYIIEPWRMPLTEADFRRYYPHGSYHEYYNPSGEETFFTFRITAEDQKASRGLHATYYATPDWQGKPLGNDANTPPTTDGNLPPGTHSIRWTGTLHINQEGVYHFDNTRAITETGAQVKLFMDGQSITLGDGDTTGQVYLSRGMHAIELDYGTTGTPNFVFTWTRTDTVQEAVPDALLNQEPLPDHGLRGRYFSNNQWQGNPNFSQTDALMKFRWHPDPLGLPWSAQWDGSLVPPKPGHYTFILHSNNVASLELDGQKVIDLTADGSDKVEVNWNNQAPHQIRVRYMESAHYSEMDLSWVRPDGKEEIIPADNLIPAP